LKARFKFSTAKVLRLLEKNHQRRADDKKDFGVLFALHPLKQNEEDKIFEWNCHISRERTSSPLRNL
jgi:hypothetical protein